MKKLTTALIAVAILILIIISGRIYVGHSMSHVVNLKGVDSSDGAVKVFLEMMVPHHAEAVETSKIIMMDPAISNPEVRLFAARVADAQEFEITQMVGWYEEWFRLVYPATSTYMSMMTNTTGLVGDARAKVYLKDMIAHHEAAIESAEKTRKLIEKIEKAHSTSDGVITVMNSHPGIDATLIFTKHIEEVQKKEIGDMKVLLKTLK